MVYILTASRGVMAFGHQGGSCDTSIRLCTRLLSPLFAFSNSNLQVPIALFARLLGGMGNYNIA